MGKPGLAGDFKSLAPSEGVPGGSVPAWPVAVIASGWLVSVFLSDQTKMGIGGGIVKATLRIIARQEVLEIRPRTGIQSGMKKNKTKRGRKQTNPLHPAVRLAIERSGGTLQKLATKLHISPQALAQWGRRIPVVHVRVIEEISGIPREKLRPDIYG